MIRSGNRHGEDDFAVKVEGMNGFVVVVDSGIETSPGAHGGGGEASVTFDLRLELGALDGEGGDDLSSNLNQRKHVLVPNLLT